MSEGAWGLASARRRPCVSPTSLPAEHEHALFEGLRAAGAHAPWRPGRAPREAHGRAGRARSRRRHPFGRSQPSSGRRRCRRRPAPRRSRRASRQESSGVGTEKSRIGIRTCRAEVGTRCAYGSNSPSCVRSTKSVTPCSSRWRTSVGTSSWPQAQGCRPARSRCSTMTDGRRIAGRPGICP